MTVRTAFALLALPLLAAAAQPVRTPPAAAVPATPPVPYADLVDLALAAPVVAHVRLQRARPLRPAEAVGVAPGHTRFYMEVEAVALVRGQLGMPTELKYLVDLRNDANGRMPRPARRSEWLIFARTLPGRPGELQLVAPDAQLPFTAEAAERIRDILRAALAPDAPPALTGIGRAFHVPGTLPGASETQIFLLTAGNQPVSITVRREPGQRPQWFVSLSEFLDAGATRPTRDTLLWYRLACFLPAQLPRASFSEAREHVQAVAADYQLVREELGPCLRHRAAP